MNPDYKPPFGKLPLVDLDGPKVLSFSTSNAKLKGSHTAAFNLPAGYSCPGACDCLAYFDRNTNKLIDGPKAKYRCFAASVEAAFQTTRKSVDRNMSILKSAKSAKAMAEVIDLSLPSKFYYNIRIHADGDFFNQSYFLAWVQVATNNPDRTFYAYTKSLPFWIKYRDSIPENLVLTASWGGKWDNLIEKHNLRSARVVSHPEEADELNLEIDHDDSHARSRDGRDFALLLHGQQPAGSKAAAATKRMREEGIKYSYSK